MHVCVCLWGYQTVCCYMTWRSDLVVHWRRRALDISNRPIVFHWLEHMKTKEQETKEKSEWERELRFNQHCSVIRLSMWENMQDPWGENLFDLIILLVMFPSMIWEWSILCFNRSKNTWPCVQRVLMINATNVLTNELIWFILNITKNLKYWHQY